MVKQYNNKENLAGVDAFFAFQEDTAITEWYSITGHLSLTGMQTSVFNQPRTVSEGGHEFPHVKPNTAFSYHEN